LGRGSWVFDRMSETYGLTSDTRGLTTPFTRRYNIRVPNPTPQDDHKDRRHAVYASETTGLLLIAFLLLVLTVLRYWRDVHWSLR
jgi:hypothetical protein